MTRRVMSMAPDTAWNALTDSIRRHLADLPRLWGLPCVRRQYSLEKRYDQ